MRAIRFVMLLPLLAGCHAYVAADAPDLRRGDRLRLHLGTPGEFRIGELTAGNIIRVDGELIETNDSTVVLSAWWLRSASGLEHAADGRTVRVRREHIERLEQRRVSGIQTGLLAAGGAAASVALGALIVGGSTEGGGGGGPPGTGQ